MSNGTVLIRPVHENDLKSIVEIAMEVGFGFTSLPNNPDIIAKRVLHSVASFKQAKNDLDSRVFFFVMEDLDSKEVVGTCAIDVPAGESPPFYNYKLTNLTQKSDSLHIHKQHKILELVNDYQNTTEFGTFFIKKSFRGRGKGSLLSRSRCLFIAEFPDFFTERVIAEMRGFLDDKGNSPFWEAIGRHFFEMDFAKADYLRTVQGEQFITDLMPKYPIYVDLLSKAAQEVIGKTHLEALSALHLLEKEGFKHRGYVDIFQGGPLIEAEKSELKTVQTSQKAKVHQINKFNNVKKDRNKDNLWMISNTRLDFKVTSGYLEVIEKDKINLNEETAKILNVSIGDDVRYCIL